jgi:hypothetical protein
MHETNRQIAPVTEICDASKLAPGKKSMRGVFSADQSLGE